MNLRRGLIFLAVLVWLFLSFSNTFFGNPSALAGSQTTPRLVTPIQTMTIQTPWPPPPSPPVVTISPNQEIIAPSRASDDPSYQSGSTDVNKQIENPKPVNVQTSTPTPKPTETPTAKATPMVSPADTTKSTDGSWLPWIIAGILFVIVIFLLGRNNKD